MPSKRRLIGPQRIGERLTGEQWQRLLHGILLRGGPAPFPSEEAAKAAWFRHRAALLDPERRAPSQRYGWRPWGFWQYEVGIEPGRWGQAGAISQPHAVHKLTGDPAERAAIEADWLGILRRGILAEVPYGFARQHWRLYEQARARLEAERQAYAAAIAQQLRGGQGKPVQ
jgi:hypothetical protein